MHDIVLRVTGICDYFKVSQLIVKISDAQAKKAINHTTNLLPCTVVCCWNPFRLLFVISYQYRGASIYIPVFISSQSDLSSKFPENGIYNEPYIFRVHYFEISWPNFLNKIMKILNKTSNFSRLRRKTVYISNRINIESIFLIWENQNSIYIERYIYRTENLFLKNKNSIYIERYLYRLPPVLQ